MVTITPLALSCCTTTTITVKEAGAQCPSMNWLVGARSKRNGRDANAGWPGRLVGSQEDQADRLVCKRRCVRYIRNNTLVTNHAT